MVHGDAMRRKQLSDLNVSEEDADLDLTLSLSVGDSRGQKPAALVGQTGTHIANLRSSQLGHNSGIVTGDKYIMGVGSGAIALCPFHAKLNELSAGAGSSSLVIPADSSSLVISEESTTVQGSITLSGSRNNSRFTSSKASSVLNQPHHQPSINSFPSTSNMLCVAVRDSRPGARKVTGFIYQVASATDVVILCACHWQAFSAAGFIKHAGLTDVENPLRAIAVLPP